MTGTAFYLQRGAPPPLPPPHLGDRRAQGIDRRAVAALREIRHAFDERSGHQLFLRRSMSQRCIAALPATMEPLLSLLRTSAAPLGRVTMPPASRMSNVPAAISQG